MTFRRIALLAALVAAAGTVAGQRNPASLAALSGDYPRTFFFRQAEGLAANPKVEYAAWEKAFGRLMGIMGKTLEEEVPGRSIRNIDFFTKFKQRHPDQLVMLHYNGNARDPRDQQGRFFAGHWLYYNGAKITADIPAAAGESDIPVSDPTLFLTKIGRYRNANEDVGLCELDANGKPDWSRSEQVKLLSVDAKARTIRVQRGQYDTRPRAFAAGRACAAAHVTEGPWGAGSNLLWDYNHSTACPRDPNGRTCDDVLIDDLARHLLPGGDLAALDGLEFDVLKYGLAARRGKRGIDTDADGVADNGIVGGTDRYAEGTVAFCRRLREKLGENTLIMADGWSPGNQRAFGFLNGIEAEGWPSLRDYKVDDWSGGLNRQGFWVANSRAPVFNYINHKFNIEGDVVDASSPKVPYNIHRLVFAGAMFTDSAITFAMRPPVKPGELAGVFDELWVGEEHRLGWLGKPVGPPVHMAAGTPDLLEGRGQARIASGTGSIELTIPAVAADTDLWLSVTMRAAGPARFFRVRLGDGEEDISYGWVNDRPFAFGFYFPEARRRTVRILVEPGGPVTVSKVTAHTMTDAMYREFERGLVLANPGPRPLAFDVAKMFPGKRYRRIKGSADQDPKANDGQPVGETVRLGAKDALFLVRVL
jgi:hypothetical protein